jgi:A/G-specific adenine glycosylase
MRRLSSKQVKDFQNTIWKFYKSHKREMPWRGDKEPYRILVSEIMLQQTQVSRVLEYYPRFLKAFPTIKSLSRASLKDVLLLWQGLGYNRRAKFLHRLAQEVMERFEGTIPSNYTDLLDLPGIGEGTAGSLSAFAFNKPVVFIETNIRRVFIHSFFKNRDDISDSEIFPLIAQTLPHSKAREWYFALMDYGAYLKGSVSNPNRKSKHYIKQSKFKGSNREVRGMILRYLTQHKKLKEDDGANVLGISSERFSQALHGLLLEGFVKKKGSGIVLP